jgi:hypothetical protein
MMHLMEKFSPPEVMDGDLVGTYPARAFAGGGYVWDEVLEYRVWCHPSAGMLDEGVLPPGLTLLAAGTYGLPCK